jgi:hypothetical protein
MAAAALVAILARTACSDAQTPAPSAGSTASETPAIIAPFITDPPEVGLTAAETAAEASTEGAAEDPGLFEVEATTPDPGEPAPWEALPEGTVEVGSPPDFTVSPHIEAPPEAPELHAGEALLDESRPAGPTQ